MSAPTTTPTAWQRFQGDTTDHVMTVLHDDGVYRHLSFRDPKSSIYWYDLITSPGQLTIRGDMGTYVFARLTDMFEFFGGHPAGYINDSYWAEKVVAADRDGQVKKYDEDILRARVVEYVAEAGLSADDRLAVWAQINEDWSYGMPYDSNGAHEWLEHFSANFPRPGDHRFTFQDAWEWDLTDWSFRLIWCMHAIAEGIRQYRASAAVKS